MAGIDIHDKHRKIRNIANSVIETLEKENLTYNEAVEALQESKILLGKHAKLNRKWESEDSNDKCESKDVLCTKEEAEQTEAIRYLAMVIESGKKCGKVPDLLADLL